MVLELISVSPTILLECSLPETFRAVVQRLFYSLLEIPHEASIVATVF